MNIQTPAQVAANRTARLVAEFKAPKHTTSTPVVVAPIRQHRVVVELSSDVDGYRFWSGDMPESAVDGYIDSHQGIASLSDIDCSNGCWCGGTEVW